MQPLTEDAEPASQFPNIRNPAHPRAKNTTGRRLLSKPESPQRRKPRWLRDFLDREAAGFKTEAYSFPTQKITEDSQSQRYAILSEKQGMEI